MKLKRFHDEKVKNNDKIKVVGYIRVSTFNQEDNTSLALQEKKIKEYCNLKNWQLVKIFKEIGSGAKESRQQYNEMIQLIDKNGFNGIVVYHIDRLFRSLRLFANLYYKLSKSNKWISTIDGGLDSSTDIGAFTLKMMVLMAEMERERITKRLQSGRVENFKNTGKIGSNKKGCTGVLPFGYYYNRDGELKIDRERAEVVKTIYKMRRDGSSLDKITNELNENGILTQRAKPFNRNSVYAILKNEFYTGRYKYSNWVQEYHHEPIIKMSDWAYVNLPEKMFKAKKRLKNRKKAKLYEFPLIGSWLGKKYSNGMIP